MSKKKWTDDQNIAHATPLEEMMANLSRLYGQNASIKFPIIMDFIRYYSDVSFGPDLKYGQIMHRSGKQECVRELAQIIHAMFYKDPEEDDGIEEDEY